VMRFGSLFAGIGGFDLGLERAGMECAWQVEIDPYAQKVLAKHWPDVRRHADVCTFPPEEGDWKVDVICGGFPCQDISYAGKGAGLAGERSGLWYEFARIIGHLRPPYVIVENVSALLNRGMGEVLGTLASLGYDAEWHVIPASAVGAPHRRDRVWIVAVRNANSKREARYGISDAKHGAAVSTQARREPSRVGSEPYVADAEGISGRAGLCQGRPQQHGHQPCDCGSDVPDAVSDGSQGIVEAGATVGAIDGSGGGWWATEPDVGRVAHGVPSRVDRLRCLGNAVVPQVVELIGRAIMERECGERIVGSE
jgi:DNA (cytosine-5)-methyltransferase 1